MVEKIIGTLSDILWGPWMIYGILIVGVIFFYSNEICTSTSNQGYVYTYV